MDTLLKKAREGDAGAFTTLMQAQEQNLWRAARAILKNDADAADALQDTALRAWQRLGEVREDTSFKAWITRILVNRCCDILRGKKRLVSLDALPEQGQEEDRDLSLDVRSVLAALAENDRLILTLFYLDDLSVRQIAFVLDLKESAVRTRLTRARERFRRQYAACKEVPV